MGENKHINELDSFTKKLVKQIQPVNVSVDFTAKVMQQIMAQQKVSLVKNQPLISNKLWFVIAIITSTLVITPYFVENSNVFDWSFINFNLLENLNLSTIDINLSLSNTTFYAIVFFGVMLSIQIVYLKNYFSKRIH